MSDEIDPSYLCGNVSVVSGSLTLGELNELYPNGRRDDVTKKKKRKSKPKKNKCDFRFSDLAKID